MIDFDMIWGFLFFFLYLYSVYSVNISLQREYIKFPPADEDDRNTDLVWSFIPLLNLGLLIDSNQ